LGWGIGTRVKEEVDFSSQLLNNFRLRFRKVD
jgi:hypothetical protein